MTTHDPSTIDALPDTMTNQRSGTMMMSGCGILTNGKGTRRYIYIISYVYLVFQICHYLFYRHRTVILCIVENMVISIWTSCVRVIE